MEAVIDIEDIPTGENVTDIGLNIGMNLLFKYQHDCMEHFTIRRKPGRNCMFSIILTVSDDKLRHLF